MARITKEQQRLMVAYALLNLQKVELLQDSALVELLEIPIETESYWAQGQQLASHVSQAAETTLRKLQTLPNYQSHRDLLAAVLRGSSVAAWAREHGFSREYVSRTTWTRVTTLVTQELLQKNLKKAV